MHTNGYKWHIDTLNTGKLRMEKWLSFLVHMSRLNGCSTFRSGMFGGQIWSNIRRRLEYSMSHALVRVNASDAIVNAKYNPSKPRCIEGKEI